MRKLHRDHRAYAYTGTHSATITISLLSRATVFIGLFNANISERNHKLPSESCG